MEPTSGPEHSCEYCQSAFAFDLSSVEIENHNYVPFRTPLTPCQRLQTIRDRYKTSPMMSRTVAMTGAYAGEACVFGATYEQIYDAAGAGCAFSRLIIELLADKDASLDSAEHVLALCTEKELGNNCEMTLKRIPVNIGRGGPGTGWADCLSLAKFHATSTTFHQGNNRQDITLAKPINPNPASPQAIQLMRQWLQSCISSHPSCPKPTGYFPTRVLQMKGELPEHGVYLRETHIVKPVPGELYAALSYCWGPTPQPILATKSTLPYLRQDIAFYQLPPTIRDALFIASQVGIRSLWVDALCIVQDDDDDLGRELGKMPSIYSSAIVTIAAARAASVNEGFLGPRVMADISGFRLPFLDETRRPGFLTLKETATVDALRLQDVLETRGWCMQERLLSPRLLDFRGTQTIWSCAEIQDTGRYRPVDYVDGWVPLRSGLNQQEQDDYEKLQELTNLLAGWRVGDAETPRPTRPTTLKAPTRFTMAMLASRALRKTALYLAGVPPPPREARIGPSSLNSSAPEANRRWDTWGDLLTNYTKRQLSKPTDRLNAIAAIAKVYSAFSTDAYLAGLWKGMLPGALLWGVEEAHPRPQQYCGPTWSWCSVVGHVEHPAYLEQLHARRLPLNARIMRWDVEPMRHGAEFGEVCRARMVIYGRPRPAVLRKSNIWDDIYVVEVEQAPKLDPMFQLLEDSKAYGKPVIARRHRAANAAGSTEPEQAPTDPSRFPPVGGDYGAVDSPPLVFFPNDSPWKGQPFYGLSYLDCLHPEFEDGTSRPGLAKGVFLLPIVVEECGLDTRLDRYTFDLGGIARAEPGWMEQLDRIERTEVEVPQVHGLILQRLETGEFIRIGMFVFGVDVHVCRRGISAVERWKCRFWQYCWLIDSDPVEITIL